MSKYKKLSLWFTDLENEICYGDLGQEISPIFYSPGFYLDRLNDTTWIELDDRAFIYGDTEGFKFKLLIAENERYLSKDCMSAILTLKREKLCPESLWNKYLIQKDRQEIKEAGRSIKRLVYRFKKKKRYT